MSKIKEFLENFPAQISEAVDTAVAALKTDEKLDLEAIKAVVAEKIGELEGFISPDELDAKAEELGADLIVIGSHGRRGLALLVGSTANGVLHGAVTDVLAVRVGE